VDADALYRLPPEEFTAARDAAAKQAKAAGDKEAAAALKALRKPSASAHLVNLLATRERELLEQLLDLGPALAQAQAQGQGDALRTLGAQRRELVEAVTARAVELGEREVSAAVREEVAGTLEAAQADPSSAEAVRSGRLVRPLSYIGFGDVDLSGAVAPGPAAAAPERKKKPKDEPDRERIAAAEAAALEAAGRLDDAVRACEQAQREHERAEEQASAAHAEVERRQAALQEAEQAVRAADSARSKADKAAEKAVTAVRRAQEREERARGELDRLRRGS
jgi:hypothetical protein